MEAFALLDLRFPWKMILHTTSLESTAANTWTLLDSNCVAVEPLPGAEYMVWQGSSNEEERRKHARRREEGQRKRPNTTQQRNPRKRVKTVRKSKKPSAVAYDGDPEYADTLLMSDQEGDAGAEAEGNENNPDLLVDQDQPNESWELDPYLEPDCNQIMLEEQEEADADGDDILDAVGLSKEDEPLSDSGDVLAVKESDAAPTAAEQFELALIEENIDEHVEPAPVAAVAAAAAAAPAGHESNDSDLDQPPPDPAGPRAPKVVKGRSTLNREVFPVGDLGELRYYLIGQNMAAACYRHGEEDCRKSSTVAPKGNGSGRPIGHLVAWLRMCDQYSCKKDHVHKCRPNLSQRQEAREWFNTLPGADEFARQYEKPKAKKSDPDEPRNV